MFYMFATICYKTTCNFTYCLITGKCSFFINCIALTREDNVIVYLIKERRLENEPSSID